MRKYKPNFDDPRVKRKVSQALGYASATLSPTKPKKWSCRQIDRWFGYSHTDISQYLRQQLLVVADTHYNMNAGKCKSYTLNLDGVYTLAQHCNYTISKLPSANDLQSIGIQWAKEAYGLEIATGNFDYTEKSGRLWNEIVHLPNVIRKPLFANYGYVNEYDIKTAAPTILLQYAKRRNLHKPLTVIEDYLADKDVYRYVFAEQLNIDIKTAKKIITARFAGAKLGRGNSIYEMLDEDNHRHQTLQTMKWFNDLTRDIKRLWDTVKIDQGVSRLNARDKWHIYFQEETRIMRSVHRYLDKNNIKYFHEHDGWRCDSAVDLHQLKLHIQKQTDYTLEFDYELYKRCQ